MLQTYESETEYLKRYEDFENEELMSPKNFCKGVIDAVLYQDNRDSNYDPEMDPEPYRQSYNHGLRFGQKLLTEIQRRNNV